MLLKTELRDVGSGFGDYEEYCLLGCILVQFGERATFRKNVLPRYPRLRGSRLTILKV
jgi:hypothetical protein